MTRKRQKARRGVPVADATGEAKARRNMLKEQLRNMIIEGHPHKKCREFVLNAGYSKATASNWYREVKVAIEAVGEIRHGEDYDKMRLERVRVWDERAQRYREQADDALVRYQEVRGGTWKAVDGMEKQAIKYDQMIASALHWDKIPPDRDMSLDEVQHLVLRSLKRHLGKFRRQHVQELANECARLLAELPKEGRPFKDEAEQIL
jgi:hypothetical protein